MKDERWLSIAILEDHAVPSVPAHENSVVRPRARDLSRCGLENSDIASLLGISKPMVNEHIARLLEKLNVANRTEAVALCMRKHLLNI